MIDPLITTHLREWLKDSLLADAKLLVGFHRWRADGRLRPHAGQDPCATARFSETSLSFMRPPGTYAIRLRVTEPVLPRKRLDARFFVRSVEISEV
jgi:hypothetical protein